MLRIIVEDDTENEGCNVDIKAEGSAFVLAQQLHIVLKKLCEYCPPLVYELTKIADEELK